MQRLIILTLVAARGVCLCLGDSSTGPQWLPLCLVSHLLPSHPTGSLCPPLPGFSLRHVHPAATGAGGKTSTGCSGGKYPGGAGAVPGCPGGRWALGQGGRGGALLGTSSPHRLGQLQVLSPVAPCSPLAEAGPVLHGRRLQGDAGAATAQPGRAGGCRQAGNQRRGETGGRTSGLCISGGSAVGPGGIEGAAAGLGHLSLGSRGSVPSPPGAGIDLVLAGTRIGGICPPLGV